MNMTDSLTMRGHVKSEREKRILKARKIEHLLGGTGHNADLLDLGTGAGFIAEYFANRGARVVAADRDPREFQVSGIQVEAIRGQRLPFKKESFDIIIFNHVIEHVGERLAQDAMLSEIVRCLRPGGRLYLAVPNKWAIIEPHYRLPLLGALPRRIANALVRCLRDFPIYDCFPLARGELRSMLGRHFGEVTDLSAQAFHWAVEHELSGVPRAVLTRFPRALVGAARPVFPTLIMVARKEI